MVVKGDPDLHRSEQEVRHLAIRRIEAIVNTEGGAVMTASLHSISVDAASEGCVFSETHTPVSLLPRKPRLSILDGVAHDEFTFERARLSDIETIEAMFKRCSIQSLDRRFFRPLPSAPLGYLEEVLADRNNHAFAVQRNGEPIGLAELHLTQPSSGALALIIEDLYQRRGVGTTALQMLVSRARELGMRKLTADVRYDNIALLSTLRRVGRASIHRADDIFHVELELVSAELEN
jgi:RimJ/RimL family protein N-acetyltransferase